MTPERHRQVSELFHAALAQAPEKRQAFLADACTNDESLRREVESLLAHESPARGFLSTPAAALADAATSSSPSVMGRQVGPYAIHARLGAGGMGEVYRARDATLGRDVAIKVLPRIFSTNPERRARFDREARLLASLNHPHIGAIYGVEDLDGTPALILELVDGDTLADRLARGPIAIGEALDIARQIADALEAAHEKGIIHRDLKPANVKITPDGIVKVLDFGLGKAASGDTSGPDLTQSPTGMNAGTRDGVILGTAAYMSPEQARGKPVDKRTDIWAFGCVVYELLTGHAAFAGETLSDTLAAILEHEPNWQALPAATPDKVRDVLRRCLQKDPHRRLRDIGDARLDIDDAIAAPPPANAGATPARDTRDRLLWVAALVAAVAAAVAVTAWSLHGPQVQPDEVRFEINVPPTTELTSVAISPDGRRLVFVATSEGKSRVWLRPLDEVSARPLASTENARFPFWSPDSRSVGFFADGRLKRIDVDSGFVQDLAEAKAPHGGAWNEDGTILYTPHAAAPVYRISEDGGQATAVTQASQQASTHRFPRPLPGGRHFLLYATGAAPGIYGAQGDGSTPRRIVDAEAAAYTSSGYLLFVRQRTLLAQKFDPLRFALTGSPTAVAEHIVSGESTGAALSVSAAGPIVYRTGPEPQAQLVWIDRRGNEIEIVAGSEKVGGAIGGASSLSPDGRRLALSRPASGSADIWTLDLNRGVPKRFTFDTAFDLFPVWSPDSRRIAFTSNRKGPFHVYVKSADGTGSEDLFSGGDTGIPSDWSRDGRFLLYSNWPLGQAENSDILALSLDGDRKALPVAQTTFAEVGGRFSPDGRWVAYESNESGRPEIYVQPFPGPGGKTLISPGGGVDARWGEDGQELFYFGPDNRLMAVSLRLDSRANAVQAGTPIPLFAVQGSGGRGHDYMVSRDGQRFLMETLKGVTLPITVILNWKPRP